MEKRMYACKAEKKERTKGREEGKGDQGKKGNWAWETGPVKQKPSMAVHGSTCTCTYHRTCHHAPHPHATDTQGGRQAKKRSEGGRKEDTTAREKKRVRGETKKSEK